MTTNSLPRYVPVPTPGGGFTPIRAKSNGRYLCEYDPARHLLRFRRGGWEETIDLSEYEIDTAVVPPVESISATGYILLPVDVARLLGLVESRDGSNSTIH